MKVINDLVIHLYRSGSVSKEEIEWLELKGILPRYWLHELEGDDWDSPFWEDAYWGDEFHSALLEKHEQSQQGMSENVEETLIQKGLADWIKHPARKYSKSNRNKAGSNGGAHSRELVFLPDLGRRKLKVEESPESEKQRKKTMDMLTFCLNIQSEPARTEVVNIVLDIGSESPDSLVNVLFAVDSANKLSKSSAHYIVTSAVKHQFKSGTLGEIVDFLLQDNLVTKTPNKLLRLFQLLEENDVFKNEWLAFAKKMCVSAHKYPELLDLLSDAMLGSNHEKGAMAVAALIETDVIALLDPIVFARGVAHTNAVVHQFSLDQLEIIRKDR